MNIAIKILNEKHSRVTQELLFKYGYNWNVSRQNLVKFKSEDAQNFVPNCYIELGYVGNDTITYCEPDELDRFADTFMNLKELKEHLNENCN